MKITVKRTHTPGSSFTISVLAKSKELKTQDNSTDWTLIALTKTIIRKGGSNLCDYYAIGITKNLPDSLSTKQRANLNSIVEELEKELLERSLDVFPVQEEEI